MEQNLEQWADEDQIMLQNYSSTYLKPNQNFVIGKQYTNKVDGSNLPYRLVDSLNDREEDMRQQKKYFTND